MADDERMALKQAVASLERMVISKFDDLSRVLNAIEAELRPLVNERSGDQHRVAEIEKDLERSFEKIRKVEEAAAHLDERVSRVDARQRIRAGVVGGVVGVAMTILNLVIALWGLGFFK